MIEAVIFDFDGVVADTMTDNCVAWQQSFAAYGFQVKADEYYRLEGMGRFQIASYFIDKYHLDPAIKEPVVIAKELYYKEHNTFRLYPEIDTIFDLLVRQGIAIGIVTGASRARIGEHLDARLRDKLTALITADDVVHTKPNPEPYLKAVLELGKNAIDCLVIENAILGINSAKAAGCRCFALETTLPKEALNLADEVLGTHQELLARLQQLF